MLLKGSPSVDANITFGNYATNHQQNTCFVGEDRIAGTASFTLKKNYDNVRYRILLKGVVSTRTSTKKSSSLQSATQHESVTLVSATLFDGPQTASQSESKFVVNIPFRFIIQNDDPKVSTNWQLGPVRTLLPTVNSKSVPLHWSKNLTAGNDAQAQYRVAYTIIASASINDKKVASKAREFNFIPTTLQPSSIAVEDFPGEYALRSSKILQHGTSQSRLGVISDEPPTLSLTKAGDGAWTTVNMLLMLCRETGDYFSQKSPPRECRVSAGLRSTTFIMPRPAKPAFHTIEVASYNDDIAVREEKSHAQEYVIALEDWESQDSESEDEKTPATPFPQVCTTQSHFTFILDSTKDLPPPTFHSPLLSRRYAIDLTLTFDDDAASMMKLRLPVQIVYTA